MAYTANDLQKITEFIKNGLDKKIRVASLTARFDVANDQLKPTGIAGVYKYPQIDVGTGLENYDRTNGYTTNGAIVQAWKDFQCDYDRSKRILVDPVDDAQSAGIAIANVASIFMENHVVPEIDAVRFAKYATKAGTVEAVALTDTNIVDEYLKGIQKIQESEFPLTSFTLFVTPAVGIALRKAFNGTRYTQTTETAVGTTVATIDGIPVVVVPSNRFHTECTLNANGGFTPAGKQVEMMFVSALSVLQITDHEANRVFSPEVFQGANAWAWDYRVFHGVTVLDNKKAGIYCITEV